MGDELSGIRRRDAFQDGNAFGFVHHVPRQGALPFVGKAVGGEYGLFEQLVHAHILMIFAVGV